MANDFSKLFSGFLGSAFSGEKQGEIVTRDIFLDGEDYVYQAYLPPQINQGRKTAARRFSARHSRARGRAVIFRECSARSSNNI